MTDHKIFTLTLEDATPVMLVRDTGVDVFHYTGDYQDQAYSESNVFQDLGTLCTSEHFRDNTLVNELRDHGLLSDYERGSFSFNEFVVDVLSRENWNYDWVTTTLEQYDHKRGFCRLRAEFTTTLGQIKHALEEHPELISSWTAEVQTPAGVLIVE